MESYPDQALCPEKPHCFAFFHNTFSLEELFPNHGHSQQDIFSASITVMMKSMCVISAILDTSIPSVRVYSFCKKYKLLSGECMLGEFVVSVLCLRLSLIVMLSVYHSHMRFISVFWCIIIFIFLSTYDSGILSHYSSLGRKTGIF